MENLCPKWKGEYNNILLLNTCSIDNIISLISLYREMIEKAGEITGISLNPNSQHFISLIHRCQFDELRDYIARLASILVTYDVIVPKYESFGSESRIINILRELDISNDLYSVTLQCYSCCTTFTTVIEIGSISFVASTSLESINSKMRPKKCNRCQSAGSNLEIPLGAFNAIPSVLVVELGHLPETSCTLQPNDIYIPDSSRSLAYKLAGFTLSLDNHFYIIVNLNDIWYKYGDMFLPKLKEHSKHTSLGKLNSVLYVLHEKLIL